MYEQRRNYFKKQKHENLNADVNVDIFVQEVVPCFYVYIKYFPFSEI